MGKIIISPPSLLEPDFGNLDSFLPKKMIIEYSNYPVLDFAIWKDFNNKVFMGILKIL
jgi:hypothetical protein